MAPIAEDRLDESLEQAAAADVGVEEAVGMVARLHALISPAELHQRADRKVPRRAPTAAAVEERQLPALVEVPDHQVRVGVELRGLRQGRELMSVQIGQRPDLERLVEGHDLDAELGRLEVALEDAGEQLVLGRLDVRSELLRVRSLAQDNARLRIVER